MCKEFFWRDLKWVCLKIMIKTVIVKQGPPGPGFKKTSDGNYDAEDKKLVNLQKFVDEKDAANKKYVDDQFTPVMMTRNVFSKGISM